MSGTGGKSFAEMVSAMREVFNTGRTKTQTWRESQLQSILELLTNEAPAICQALKKDLNKDVYDSTVDEIGICISEVKWYIANLSRLMKRKKVSLSMTNIGGSGYIKPEPLGLVLNIGAWNYPFQLIISPLLGIIAAGNCCVLKPSELSMHTSRLVAELIPKYLDNDCVKVVEGAVPETTALLKERWDHIMYTGSGVVGKIVYRAASEHLTPCTLELGGKCPTYVDDQVDLDAVANRLTWYKFKNAGQTCLAADYVLVHEAVKDLFLKALCQAIRDQYTSDPINSPDYCRLVNDRHFKRICALLDSAPNKKIIIGGDRNADAQYIGPTVVTGINLDDKLMQEEIFGPILPVLTVQSHQEAIDFINSREKPLHLNVFSHRQAVIDEFVERTSSGGMSANDGLVFRVERGLPFGGVGASGFGAYGGDGGFLNFSHQKSVLVKSMGMEWLFKMMRYAPHSQQKLDRIHFLTSKLPRVVSVCWKVTIPVLVLLTGLAVFLGLYGAGYIPKVDL